jgi:hypothetical protein
MCLAPEGTKNLSPALGSTRIARLSSDTGWKLMLHCFSGVWNDVGQCSIGFQPVFGSYGGKNPTTGAEHILRVSRLFSFVPRVSTLG